MNPLIAVCEFCKKTIRKFLVFEVIDRPLHAGVVGDPEVMRYQIFVVGRGSGDGKDPDLDFGGIQLEGAVEVGIRH